MGLDIFWCEKTNDNPEPQCIKEFRKANFIVKHFNLDNCTPCYCSKEDIECLNEKCKIVLKEKTDSVSSQELPTTSGFFFGDTSYNEWYYHNVEELYDFTTDVLNTFDFYKKQIYVSAWW